MKRIWRFSVLMVVNNVKAKFKKKIYDIDIHSCHSKRYLAKYLSDKRKDLYVKINELRNVDKTFHSKGREFYQSKITGERFSEKPLDYSPKKYRKFNDAHNKHKKILKRINYYLNQIQLPSYYFSKEDYCYKYNATYHKGNTKFILMDIENFFPNCNFRKVKDFCAKESGLYLVSKKKLPCGEEYYETDIADIFARLVTAPKNKNLNNRIIPQGYPTSTNISFLAYKEMFDEINDYAKSLNYKFSVYVDDLTFSYKEEIINPKEFIEKIINILNKYCHNANKKKIKIIDIEKKVKNKKTGKEETVAPVITGIFLRRYLIKASPKIHKKLNRQFNKVNSSGRPLNSKEYIRNWSNYNSLVGLYHTVEFIEPQTKEKRKLIKNLISKKRNDYLHSVSISRIKQLKWEDKVFNVYKSGRLLSFYNKNKDKLADYKSKFTACS